MDAFKILVDTLAHNTIIQLVVIAVVMDTLFGAGRALKQHKFNSSVGIDGAIRKISMLVSLVFLAVIDGLVHINLIGFIPEEARAYFPQNISTIGLAEFFGLLYLCYEVVSILKNMALCGLPVKKLWEAVRKFLGKYTEELPDTEEQDVREEQQKIIAVATDNIPEGALENNDDGTVKVFDEDGQEVGSMTKGTAEMLAAAATEVKVEQ